MNKYIILLVALVTSISFAQNEERKVKKVKKEQSFEREYGMAGCGLGSVLVGKHGTQTSASTTNGSSSNQMIGISVGTLNCVDSPTSEVANRMDQFILVNRVQVQSDVARGNGETLAVLGQFMGCSQSANIGSELKSKYNDIFQSNRQVNEITDSVISVILSNPQLAADCGHLG